MIFVDTGAWYAAEVEDDVNHLAARKLLAEMSKGGHGVPLTTDYVLDETMTLLRSRRGLGAATTFVDKVRSSESVRVAWVDESLFERSLELFRKSDGKRWSFTDCTSFALMKQLSVSEAFAFDSHFEEAGFATLP
ncbi:MAG: type II toxin-antitoxin system VapC family toxin [Thaumarchaeota archaeon]|nr:type II toxin-antitoxin system VapC family toxin [Nitrososphaerota archaeon]